MSNQPIEVCIVKGIGGTSVYINDYRICGEKPWGGGKVVETWKVRLEEILRALKETR